MFNEFLTGRGKTKKEALQNAWDAYVYENGHRCDLRDTISAELKRTVPPTKSMTRVDTYRDQFGRKKDVTVHYSGEDASAPKSEWEQEWTFEVWVHA